MPLLTRGTGGDTAVVGWVGTAFFVATMLARVPAGWIADRLGQRGPLMVGAAIVAAGAVLLTSAASPGRGRGVSGAAGVGLALFTTALMPVLASLARPGTLTSTLSQFAISTNVAAALSPLISIGLFQGGRAAIVFWFAALACIAGVLLALRAPESNLPAEQPAAVGARALWWPAAVAIGTFGITYAVHVDFVPIIGASRAIPASGLYYTVYALTVIGTRAISGRIGDRHGRAWLVMPGAVAAVVAARGRIRHPAHRAGAPALREVLRRRPLAHRVPGAVLNVGVPAAITDIPRLGRMRKRGSGRTPRGSCSSRSGEGVPHIGQRPGTSQHRCLQSRLRNHFGQPAQVCSRTWP